VTAGQEILGLDLRVEGHSTDNMVVRERMKGFARVGVPNLTVPVSYLITREDRRKGLLRHSTHWPFVTITHAEKSALPVTALDASSEIFVDQTAPLWPGKVR
jgi:hypothetical protein